MTLWFRNVASLLSEGDSNGTGQRFIIIAAPQGPNNEGGPSVGAGQRPRRSDNYLHTNPYPNTASPGPDAGVRGGQRALRSPASRSSATSRATRARTRETRPTADKG